MIIQLKKFGTTLTSRQTGREAFSAFAPNLSNIPKDEMIEIDFEGVNTLSPSWGDEFLAQLHYKYPKQLVLKNTNNPSVRETISTLEETNEIKFNK